MILIMAVVCLFGVSESLDAAQESDSRTFIVVTQPGEQPSYSVHVRLPEDLTVADTDRASSAEYKLMSSLYLRVAPERTGEANPGETGFWFSLTDKAIDSPRILPTNQPAHGFRQENVQASHFRNSDNTGPNELGPKNVNVSGAYRRIEFADYVLEIRVLSFEIISIGLGRVPSFSRLDCVVTVSRRGH